MDIIKQDPINFSPLPDKFLDPSVAKPKLKNLLPLFLIISTILVTITVVLTLSTRSLTTKTSASTNYIIKPSLIPTLSPTPTLIPTIIPTITPQPSATPTLTPTVTPTPTPAFKNYTSPVIGDDFYSFQLTYPYVWELTDKYSLEEPKGLNVTLVDEYGNNIIIVQANGLSEMCVYYDDPDYTNFNGTASFFSSYFQLDKPAPWRISQNKDTSVPLDNVCEKNKDGRYITLTKIGWVFVKSVSSNNSIKLILESIVLKPTATTKTVFD
jgi:hypothetical protein